MANERDWEKIGCLADAEPDCPSGKAETKGE